MPKKNLNQNLNQKIAFLLEQVPSLKKYVNLPLTNINQPEIILNDTRIRIKKEDYEKIRKLGYDIEVGCVAACGFGYLLTNEDGEYIEFEVQECYCHPGHYFLVLTPTKKEG